jgi:hypothetical protein
MQNNNHTSLLLNHHQVAWLLVLISVGIAVAFGAGYFIGKNSVDCRDGASKTIASLVINQATSSCNNGSACDGSACDEKPSGSLHTYKGI